MRHRDFSYDRRLGILRSLQKGNGVMGLQYVDVSSSRFGFRGHGAGDVMECANSAWHVAESRNSGDYARWRADPMADHGKLQFFRHRYCPPFAQPDRGALW